MTSCFADEDVPLYRGATIRSHIPLLCGIKASQVQEPNISVLNLSTMNWLKWSSELDQLLLMIENTDDTTYLWNRFLEALKDVTNNICGKKSICSHSKPYWNDNLTLLCNQMRIARKRYQSRNIDYNYANYAEAKKEFDDARKAACSEFLLKQTQNLNTSEANQFWNTFNKTFGSKSNKQIGPLLIDKGEYVLNDHKIEAALFATFFI